MLGKYLFKQIFPKLFFLFKSVMYRKYKEQKDNEYETIIRRQVNESKLIAEQEGISIPKTLEDYVAPSRAGAIGSKSGPRHIFSLSSHEEDDDLGIDVSEKNNMKIILLFFLRKDDEDHMPDMAGDDDDGSYNDSD
jgi:hypothetical protein